MSNIATPNTQSLVAKNLFSYKKFWAARFGTAPFLPTTREEMDELGWDSCDVIIITGDAYVDHPSFGMAILGRLLEAQGFRVGIIAQPNCTTKDDFTKLGRPNLYFGITAGNMDSMVNRYTSDRRIRHNDAYTPNNEGGKRPDYATIPYSQRAREAYKGIPIIIGGIEASLRRIAHYDYWSETVRRSMLLDSHADILLFGNAERAIVELTHRMARGEKIADMRDIRGTAIALEHGVHEGFTEINSSSIDKPGKIEVPINPYLDTSSAANTQSDLTACNENETNQKILRRPSEGDSLDHQKNRLKEITQSTPNNSLNIILVDAAKDDLNDSNDSDQLATLNDALEIPTTERIRANIIANRTQSYVRLPSYEAVKTDPVLYAHTSRLLHLETNPYNARPLVQQHGNIDIWVNPAPIPLTMEEMDKVFGVEFARNPHPSYGDANIPAWEMIKFSVNIMRGCFGGCTFCSITEHEGRIIQSRSEGSILKEIEEIRDKTKGFTGAISDLGGPTANMYRLSCKDPNIEKHCRKLSCVYPEVCSNLNTSHAHLTKLYRNARQLKGVKRILIASGLRYDLAIRDPEYVKELVTHHVGGYLKIAPEHTESGPLSKMMKPTIANYDQFKALFEKFSKEAGKEQYLIPYFIAAHPGTTDEDMMNLALWLKSRGFRADQVQGYLPTPMSMAGAMYHSGKNPLKAVKRDSEEVFTPKTTAQRRLHKAFLRYHDAENWPLLRAALTEMGRSDLIGNSKKHLVPLYQPVGTGLSGGEGKRVGQKHGTQTFLTKGVKPFTPLSQTASKKQPNFMGGKSTPGSNPNARNRSAMKGQFPIIETGVAGPKATSVKPSKKGWAKAKKR